MIRYAILGSGSSANAYLIGYQGKTILIDCGFSFKELKRRAELVDADLSTLQAVLLSHTHADHMKGVATLSRACKVPVYLHHMLDGSIFSGKKPIPLVPVTPGETYTIGPFSVRVFSISHDAAYAVNFHITVGGRVLMVATDTGIITSEMQRLMDTADILFLEANYDEEMLADGPYPYYLKQRIASDTGHLSNSDAIQAIQHFSSDERPSRVFLCHMSAVNNHPQILQQRVYDELGTSRKIVVCAKGSRHTGELQTL